jgi:DNA-binding response OmpR family regulator
MLKLAIIEDHDELRESIADHLCAQGYRVGSFPCVEDFVASDYARDAAILLLDLMLPGEDGVSFSRSLRAQGSTVGIIMLTARSEIQQRAFGYTSGADIYLTKPSSPEEITAAVRALALRLPTAAQPGTDLTLLRRALKLRGPKGTAQLSAVEVEILATFAKSAEGRLPVETLCRICGYTSDHGVPRKQVEVRMARLRRKIETCDDETQILAVRGWGYQLSKGLILTD